MKSVLTVGLALMVCALVGCGEKGPETAKVTGKVTLADGQPLPGGRVDFHSPELGMAAGTINGDGSYEALDVKPGEYKVSIENTHLKGMNAAPVPEGTQAMPGSDQSYVEINPKYRNPETSGLTITVGKGEQTFNIELK